MKRVFIIHGWDGHPDEQWFPWLKQSLEEKGCRVEVPQMPDPEIPRIETWVPFLASIASETDSETYFVGHSIGVQTILRYLETVEGHAGGVVSVAGFFELTPSSLESKEVVNVATPWLTTPMDIQKIKTHAGHITAIFSDNDKYVSPNNVQRFENDLGAKSVVLHDKGHIGAGDHVVIVPEILQAVLEMME